MCCLSLDQSLELIEEGIRPLLRDSFGLNGRLLGNLFQKLIAVLVDVPDAREKYDDGNEAQKPPEEPADCAEPVATR